MASETLVKPPGASPAPRRAAPLPAAEASLTPLGQFAHFWIHVVQSFILNRCPVRASALAYTTLLALVPLLAVVVSVSTGLLKSKGEKPMAELIDQMVGYVAPQLDLAVKGESVEAGSRRKEIVTNISNYIANIQSGTLGATGVISLVFIAIMLLANIETTVNDIWGVARGRPWVMRVIYYWATITLGPVILLLVLGLTTGPHFASTKVWLEKLPVSGQFLFNLVFSYLPFLVISLAFTLFYQLMPNTRVRFTSALAGGIVGGCLWQLNNLFNVIYVSNVVSYSKIYGTFGMVPIFLAGLYLSWMILLFGAQVSYAFQNRVAYFQEKQAGPANQRGREFVALRLMTEAARRFQTGEKAATVLQFAQIIGIPSRMTAQIIQTLAAAGLLMEVHNGETAFAPARPLDRITAHDILEALRVCAGREPATSDEPMRAVVRGEFDQIQNAEREVAEGITLESLVKNAKPA